MIENSPPRRLSRSSPPPGMAALSRGIQGSKRAAFKRVAKERTPAFSPKRRENQESSAFCDSTEPGKPLKPIRRRGAWIQANGNLFSQIKHKKQ
jgi:hypothetical protein